MNSKKSKNRSRAENKQKSNKNPVLVFKFSDFLTKDYQIITTILILLPLLIYWQAYDFTLLPFWDDTRHLKNSFVLTPTQKNLGELFSQSFFNMYVPITYFIWGALKYLAELLSLPLNSVLHLTNVAVHIVNGLLVFTLVKQFVVNKWAVLIGTLFFLLHPIQVEVVAWVSEFRNLLAFCFSLTALYLYLKNQAKPSFLSLLLFTLALLSKPSAVVLPFMMAAINYFYYGFTVKDNIKKILPYLMLTFVIVIIVSNIQSYDLDANPNLIINYAQRVIVWLDGVVFYLYKLIYPVDLVHVYGFAAKLITLQWWFYPLALVSLSLGWLLWRKCKKNQVLIFSAVLFLIGFLPTSGFVTFIFQQHSLVADRYLYFSMIGVSLATASIADKKYWRISLLSILLVFTLLSAFRQIPVWQNSDTLWFHSKKYGSYYSQIASIPFIFHKAIFLVRSGEKQQAIKHLNNLIKHYPKDDKFLFIKYRILYSDIFHNRGVFMFKEKDYHKSLKDFNQAITINNNNANAHSLKIYSLILLKQCKQAQTALKEARQHKIKLQEGLLNQLKSQCPKQQ